MDNFLILDHTSNFGFRFFDSNFVQWNCYVKIWNFPFVFVFHRDLKTYLFIIFVVSLCAFCTMSHQFALHTELMKQLFVFLNWEQMCIQCNLLIDLLLKIIFYFEDFYSNCRVRMISFHQVYYQIERHLSFSLFVALMTMLLVWMCILLMTYFHFLTSSSFSRYLLPFDEGSTNPYAKWCHLQELKTQFMDSFLAINLLNLTFDFDTFLLITHFFCLFLAEN